MAEAVEGAVAMDSAAKEAVAKEGGGGISCHKSGIRSLVSENSTFRRNLAEFGNGGAVKAIDDSRFALGVVLFEKCVFEDNNATDAGGAFYARSGTAEYAYFAGCSFTRNNAAEGGAVSGSDTIINDSNEF